jgi:protein TonB
MAPPPIPARAPDPPPPGPVEDAEMTPSSPAPASLAAPSPAPPAVQARPPWGRARAWRNAASRTNQANNGAAWMAKLEQWRDQHAVDPRDASQINEAGDVKLRLSIASSGQVTSVQVVQGSGSNVLDAAAQAVFRNARLPPFPPDAPAQPADVVVTVHYHPSGAGG